ncbi:MAG: CHAT domain-containing protein [Vicinamibacterales bacterium]
MEFRDFNIEILGRRDGRFDLRVSSRASGELQASVALEREVDELLGQIADRGTSARSAGADRAFTPDVPSDPEPERRGAGVGQVLYDLLFSEPEMSRALAECMTDAKGAGAGVRLKLTMNTRDPAVADLARLPWELLHDESKYKHFGLRPDSPIVRYLEVPKPFEVGRFTPPLRVLVVAANPRQDLALDRERANLEAALSGNPDVEITFVDHATIQTIAAALSRARAEGRTVHVVHYMGHGDFHRGRGVLLLHRESGGEDLVEAEAFATALQAGGEVRLVFLNACNTAQSAAAGSADPFSGVATSLVFEGIPAVVAMQRPVPDAAAIVLAKHFYSNVARGWPVDSALAEGRRQMFFAERNTLDWAIPVLFMRSPNGVLFDFAGAVPPPATRETAPPPPRDTTVRVPEPVPASRQALWVKLAVAGVVVVALVSGAVYALSGPSQPAQVQMFALDPTTIATGESVTARLQMTDANGQYIQGSALARYGVEWTESPAGTVRIEPREVTAESRTVDAVVTALRPPPNGAPADVRARLTAFPTLTDARGISITLGARDKDAFRDAYRDAVRAFEDDSLDDRAVAARFADVRTSYEWMLGSVDEMAALNDREKAGAKALRDSVAQLNALTEEFATVQAIDKAEALPAREQAWRDYQVTVEGLRPSSPTAAATRAALASLAEVRATSATVDQILICAAGSFAGTRCTTTQTTLRSGLPLYFSVVWRTPVSDRLTFSWGAVDAAGTFAQTPTTLTTDREAGRSQPRNWWGTFTPTGTGPYELRARNGRGVLVWKQRVTLQ